MGRRERASKYRKLIGKVNIVHYVTRRYMQLNRKRTFTTLAGIVFMVLLMTCVFVGKDTAVDYLQSVASVKYGKWHFDVYDVTGEQESYTVVGFTEVPFFEEEDAADIQPSPC